MVATASPALRKATATVLKLSKDEHARMLYEAEIKARRDYNAGLSYARQEGWQEGRQEGWQEGRQEGEAKLLIRLLSRRFGPLPMWAETRVNTAESGQLEKWADVVLDASSLTEVLGAAE